MIEWMTPYCRQAACTAAGIGVPLDALLAGRRTIFEEGAGARSPEPPTTEAERRAKARQDFEDAVFKDL